MKKLVLAVLLAGLFLWGCSDEFLAHDTLYKTNDHLKFSWYQYKSPTADMAAKSSNQGWWGEAIPYIPAE